MSLEFPLILLKLLLKLPRVSNYVNCLLVYIWNFACVILKKSQTRPVGGGGALEGHMRVPEVS